MRLMGKEVLDDSWWVMGSNLWSLAMLIPCGHVYEGALEYFVANMVRVDVVASGMEMPGGSDVRAMC